MSQASMEVDTRSAQQQIEALHAQVWPVHYAEGVTRLQSLLSVPSSGATEFVRAAKLLSSVACVNAVCRAVAIAMPQRKGHMQNYVRQSFPWIQVQQLIAQEEQTARVRQTFCAPISQNRERALLTSHRPIHRQGCFVNEQSQ
jgi:hypothetical protein